MALTVAEHNISAGKKKLKARTKYAIPSTETYTGAVYAHTRTVYVLRLNIPAEHNALKCK